MSVNAACTLAISIICCSTLERMLSISRRRFDTYAELPSAASILRVAGLAGAALSWLIDGSCTQSVRVVLSLSSVAEVRKQSARSSLVTDLSSLVTDRPMDRPSPKTRHLDMSISPRDTGHEHAVLASRNHSPSLHINNADGCCAARRVPPCPHTDRSVSSPSTLHQAVGWSFTRPPPCRPPRRCSLHPTPRVGRRRRRPPPRRRRRPRRPSRRGCLSRAARFWPP